MISNKSTKRAMPGIGMKKKFLTKTINSVLSFNSEGKGHNRGKKPERIEDPAFFPILRKPTGHIAGLGIALLEKTKQGRRRNRLSILGLLFAFD
ncbi:MAG: hypothetical protein ACE5JU_03175 [Candidatus Binatia bacterium]